MPRRLAEPRSRLPRPRTQLKTAPVAEVTEAPAEAETAPEPDAPEAEATLEPPAAEATAEPELEQSAEPAQD